MSRFILPLFLALMLPAPFATVNADDPRGRDPHAGDPHAGRPRYDDFRPDDLADDIALPPSFEVLSLSTAAQIVEDRFEGKLIAARLVPPNAQEWENGIQLVHELRLLTPGRDVLQIRLDARSGRFLEVAGAGLNQARKKKGSHP